MRRLLPEAKSLEAMAAAAGPPRSFRDALSRGAAVAVIAEIKRRSPSKGAIAEQLSAAAQARAYADGGAAAVSVLTEPTQFGGAIEDLDAARPCGLPLLRKDFIIDRLQLLEARAHGASAVLLIARALPPDRLVALHSDAIALGLDVLAEVHDEDELATVLAAKCEIVGVNNRDLESLAIDDRVSARLLPRLPRAVTAIYESGVATRADVERAASYGADVVLVGSSLSAAPEVAAAVRSFTGVARVDRHAS